MLPYLSQMLAVFKLSCWREKLTLSLNVTFFDGFTEPFIIPWREYTDILLCLCFVVAHQGKITPAKNSCKINITPLLFICLVILCRPVGTGGAMSTPDFGRSLNLGVGGHCVLKWILHGHFKPTPNATVQIIL